MDSRSAIEHQLLNGFKRHYLTETIQLNIVCTQLNGQAVLFDT